MDFFVRSEGTTSFFTRDTKEVDDNVTRHLEEELDPSATDPKSKDWDFLILHYLGLDHAGHQSGAHSSLMSSKQREMDAVARAQAILDEHKHDMPE